MKVGDLVKYKNGDYGIIVDKRGHSSKDRIYKVELTRPLNVSWFVGGDLELVCK